MQDLQTKIYSMNWGWLAWRGGGIVPMKIHWYLFIAGQYLDFIQSMNHTIFHRIRAGMLIGYPSLPIQIILDSIPTACTDGCVPTRNRMKCLHNSNSAVGTNRGVKQTPGTQRNQTHSHKSDRIQSYRRSRRSTFSPPPYRVGAWKRPNQRIRTVEMSEEKKNKQTNQRTWGLRVRRGGIRSGVPPAAPGG